jgi:hypothetical protein
MASIECEVCSKAYSEQKGKCYRFWHDVEGDVLPPHEPLSVEGFAYECPDDARASDPPMASMSDGTRASMEAKKRIADTQKKDAG